MFILAMIEMMSMQVVIANSSEYSLNEKEESRGSNEKEGSRGSFSPLSLNVYQEPECKGSSL